jgi:phage shock protein E
VKHKLKLLVMLVTLVTGSSMANDKVSMIIDVRTQNEWDLGHIDRAVHLPLDSFEGVIESLVIDKGTPVYLYCRSGNRSSNALQIMQKLGYTNVVNVGGINEARKRFE